MITIASWFKKVGIFGALLLVVAASASGLLPRNVLAAGESYTWVNSTTIKVSGGELKADSQISKNSTLPNQPISFSGFLTLSGKGSGGADCFINPQYTLSSDNQSASVKAVPNPGGYVSAPGSPGPCPSSVWDSYNGTTVTIGGTAPSGTDTAETQAQKTVNITYYSSLPANQSPTSITISAKDQSGNAVAITNNTLSRTTNSSNLANGVASYWGQLILDPGTYSVCISPSSFVKDPGQMGANGCTSIKKAPYISASYDIGQTTQYDSGGMINVTVKVARTGGVQNLHIPAINLALQQPDGTSVDTAQTAPFDVTASSQAQQAAGSITQTVNQSVHASFSNVKVGTYNVCVTDINPPVCKSVVKGLNQDAVVEIDLNTDQSGTLVSTNTSTQTTPTCESDGFTLNWILCPIFNGVADFSQWVLKNIVQPFLVVSPVSTDSKDPSYQAWSSFRVYGDVILVVALLVIVFGQSIGGGLVDAYTAKKVLPRLLVAAILINLSVYIVALAVDISNILGKGIASLLVEPFKAAGQLNFSPNDTQIAGVFSIGILGTVLTAGSIGTVIITLLHASAGGAATTAAVGLLKAGVFAGLMIAIPMLLAILAVFVTLIIRQGIILFLIIISPVAFALYCLPNTEHYFKRWWKLLAETLLVYPIIMIVFAVADILSGTIMNANHVPINSGGNFITSSSQQIFAVVIAFLLQFMPLFAVPFAFRIAGGTLGKLHEMITTGAKHMGALTEGRRETAKRDFGVQRMQQQQKYYSGLNAAASKRKGFRKAALGFAAGRMGGYNIEAAMSGQRAQMMKEMDEQIATGDDTEIRALSVNKSRARRAGALGVADTDGWRSNGQYRENADGRKQFRTLGGRWVDEAAVDRAYGRWGTNQMAQQKSLSYEMQKATTQEENDNLFNNYQGVAAGWGQTSEQSGSTWTGAAFAQQNTNRQWKHYSVQGDGGLRMNGVKLMQEIDERQGNYAMMQQNADTWTTMGQEVVNAHAVVTGQQEGNVEQAQEVLQRAARIAYATEASSMAGTPVSDDQGQGTGQVIRGGREVGAGAPGRVQEEMSSFVKITKQLAGPYTPPDDSIGPRPQGVPRPGDSIAERRGNDRDR